MIAGLLLLLLLPGHITAISAAIQLRPFASLVYGFGGLAAIVILTVLTAGSALGSVLIPLANLGALLTGLFGGTAICVWLGRRLQQNHPTAHFRHFWLGLVFAVYHQLDPPGRWLFNQFDDSLWLRRYPARPLRHPACRNPACPA